MDQGIIAGGSENTNPQGFMVSAFGSVSHSIAEGVQEGAGPAAYLDDRGG